MEKVIKIILSAIIIFNLYLCAYSVINHDIAYHTDIARDFLILQEVTETHKPPLIGPRTGGIDGLFHGPLWTWINLPAFMVGNGDPIVIGWFWVLLVVFSVLVTFLVADKVFGRMAGLMSALIISGAWVEYSNSLYNPSGALIFSPLFFYFFYKYVQTMKGIYLAFSFFVIGILIQFEVAFGGPMLILATLFLIFFLFKKKKLFHLLYILVIAIPLSTYIAFDVRHDFLQLRSILSSIGKETGSGSLTLSQIFQNRIDGAMKSILLIPSVPIWFSLGTITLFTGIIIKSVKDKKLNTRSFYLLFAYFYIGFWPISFYLNGYVLGFHVLPFLPIAIIIFASSYKLVGKEIFALLLVCILFFTYSNAKTKIDNFATDIGNDAGSWSFNKQLAEDIFQSAPNEFGYFVFTPDEWGYGPKYAMKYLHKKYSDKSISSNTKMTTTYLIMAPALENIEGNREWWIKNRVQIDRQPVKITDYTNNYKVHQYELSAEEKEVPSDPNLVDGLFFR